MDENVRPGDGTMPADRPRNQRPENIRAHNRRIKCKFYGKIAALILAFFMLWPIAALVAYGMLYYDF